MVGFMLHVLEVDVCGAVGKNKKQETRIHELECSLEDLRTEHDTLVEVRVRESSR